ncbi:lipoate--protein ligase [Paenibacillus swuensis]|uniref:lipoate--protein ligase n=1 Tax=Paenibacillus swuensis TaxID=1178515 RepID=A0A172TLJ6_9BACL|nr:lipoate--protein ligase [Paenibacillus swuensis]ANE47784.1 lipoate--protein ligase [Paenibacillus swuensis]
MLFIDHEGHHDPGINLAIEEFALRHLNMDQDYLLFYINEPSIIIGKNQNTLEEINLPYVKENQIHVVRRLSGGGAVYHDLGNLNFSFITKDDGKSFNNYKKFTEPVVQALRSMGVEAELTGRNDIQVGERKISGNAQFSTRGRMFTHGTLLFNTEMDHVVQALNVNPEKIQSKGVKSVRSRVANITEFLADDMTIEQFKQHILRAIYGEGQIEQYKLTDTDWVKIREISEDRYRNWDWNFGQSPQYNFRNSKRFEGIGTIDVRLEIEQGIIREAHIYGDFFGTGDVAEIAERLMNVRHTEEDLTNVLKDVNVKTYFGPIEQSDFIALCF